MGRILIFKKNTTASDSDIFSLRLIKEKMCSLIYPFFDSVVTIPKSLFDSVDPKNYREDISVLSSNYLIPLEKDVWKELVRLQEKYGNLSNESISVILSFDEIRQKKLRVAWGHDRSLDLFCREYVDDIGIPLMEGIQWENRGKPMTSYHEYEELYNIAKRP